jgi:hypothetical protein
MGGSVGSSFGQRGSPYAPMKNEPGAGGRPAIPGGPRLPNNPYAKEAATTVPFWRNDSRTSLSLFHRRFLSTGTSRAGTPRVVDGFRHGHEAADFHRLQLLSLIPFANTYYGRSFQP